MQHNYHNTTDSTGVDLTRYEDAALSQEQRILKYMENNWHVEHWSPSVILNCLFTAQVPLTSVRRAFSNLTKKKLLVKTDIQKPGPYRRPEYQWKLPSGQQGLF